MLTKICSRCKKEKQLSEFYPNSRCNLGVEGQCKQCRKEIADMRKEEKKLKDREYSLRPEVKEKRKQYQKIYYEQNKEKLKQQAIENYHKNKSRYHEYDKQRAKDPKRIQWKENWLNNRNKIESYQKSRDNKKRYSTNQVKIDKCIMNYLTRSIKSDFNLKSDFIYKDNLGFNITDFKKYLEKQFTPEMNWDNYGSYWEIDHIIPKNCFRFNSVDDRDFKICWSLINLRPLTVEENRKRPRDLGSDIPDGIKQVILGQFLDYDNIKLDRSDNI